MLPLIEAQVVNAASTGLGGIIIPQLTFPLLSEQIESRVAEVELLFCCSTPAISSDLTKPTVPHKFSGRNFPVPLLDVLGVGTDFSPKKSVLMLLMRTSVYGWWVHDTSLLRMNYTDMLYAASTAASICPVSL